MKFLALLIVTGAMLFGSEHDTEIAIMDRIAKALTSVEGIAVYAPDPKSAAIVGASNLMYPAAQCDKAALILVDRNESLPGSCDAASIPVFMLNYRGLKHSARAVGAFYWLKGRPNVTFLRPRLERLGIALPEEFDRYVESEL